jgi:trans-aconitate methyltransferase
VSTPRRASDTQPALYGDLSSWWPLISTPEDYAEEAAFYRGVVEDAAGIPVREVLELGSGGGNNASHLKAHWRMTLVDLSPGMLEVSRKLNPELEHHQGDMRSVRLGRQFDAVFIHDAIDYIKTEADLRATFETAFLHCRPGGAAVLAPDHVLERFEPETDHGGHDGDGRSARYLEWTRAGPENNTYVTDYAFLLADGDDVRVVHDRHTGGLFKRQDWVDWLSEAGFEVTIVPFVHSEFAPGQVIEVFSAKRPR